MKYFLLIQNFHIIQKQAIVCSNKHTLIYPKLEEDFYTLSLDIKGKPNIEAALDAYVKADRLEGDNAYYCEKYGRYFIDSTGNRRSTNSYPTEKLMQRNAVASSLYQIL